MFDSKACTAARNVRCTRRDSFVVRGIVLTFFTLASLTTLESATGDEAKPPLQTRIDQLIAEANAGVAAPPVGDAEFLRRASLDLIGIPPAVDELRTFLADQSPGKREAAVDRLLAHPRYARHMAEVFDVMFMERRPATAVSADEWHQYLLKAFRENRPYNQLAKEILAADGADPNPRAAVRFYLDRQADPNLLTRDVGRVFFGRDLQCAQCHDHPLIDDYHQADYHGLLGFFNTGAAFTAPAPDGKIYYTEKAGGLATFESVFIKGEVHTIGAKMLGQPELEEPTFYPDEQYTVAPADGVRPVPKFSRRAKLAELATSGADRAFNENIANRLWAHLMGRGLVNPVDLHHSSNPPSNPALMKMLGEEFAAGGFDVKAFWRALALTQTYQRSIDPPQDPIAYVPQATELAGKLEGQVQELTVATDQADEKYVAAVEQCTATDESAKPVVTELEQATTAAAAAAAKLAEAKAALAAAEAQIAAKTAVSATLTDAVAKTQEVAKALPQDQELVAAAQKFAERQQQVTAEIGTLTEDAKLKTAAVQAPTEAVTAARQAFDAVRTKFAPLADAIKQQEQLVEASRQLWMEQRTARVRYEEQLETVKQLAALKPLQDEVAAATAQVSAAETALSQARSAADAHQTTLAAAEQARVAAEQQAAAAAAAAAAAKQEQDRVQQIVSTVEEALAKTEAAKQLLPEDASLLQVSITLTAKREELKAAVQAPAQKVAEAAAVEQTAKEQLTAVSVQSQAAIAEMAQRQAKIAEAEQSLNVAKAQCSKCTNAFGDSLESLKDEWTENFAVLPLKPLTPEQMCWSIFQVTGVYDRYVVAEIAEMDKTAPLSEEDKKDAAKVAARELELQQRVYDKLKSNVGTFVSMYAPAAGQPQTDFFATANQALFAANGGSITGWAAPSGGNVAERMIQQADPKAAAEELYLTILSRLPDEAEIGDVTQYLAARPEEKAACVQELVWGLLTSIEFRFNH